LPPDACPWLQICQNCFCGRGWAPDPTGGGYSAPPDPVAILRDPTSNGTGKGEEERRRSGEEWDVKGRGGEGKVAPPVSNSWIRS